MSKDELAAERNELAEQRTDWAEDRTYMASQRTFAGWIRTGVAAMALGLGFQAIFKAFDPTYVAKIVSTLFIAIGVFMIATAYVNARSLAKRMESHVAKPFPIAQLRLIAGAFVMGGTALSVVLWLL